MRTLITVVLAMSLVSSVMASDPPGSDLPKLSTKVKTLAVFKNGLGVLIRSGETPLTGGWASMDEIPAAAMGTLWIGCTNPATPVEQVLACKTKTTEQYDVLTITDMLLANVGKIVTVTQVRGTGTESVTGKVMSVPTPTPTPIPDSGPYRSVLDPGSGIVLIDINGRTVAMSRNSISSVDVFRDAATKVSRDVEKSGAKVKLKGTPDKGEIVLSYLQKGLIWTPGYLLDLLTDKQASITMEAVLVNDVEDMEDVDVSFVVGYPNFMYADVMTPLALQRNVANFVDDLGRDRRGSVGGGFGGVMAQSMVTNVGDYMYARLPASAEAYSAAATMPGESNEDLYFYKQGKVSLKKGERARFTVFTSKVPIEHVYTLDLPDTIRVDYRGYRQNNDDKTNPESQVWHSVKLTNDTKLPWTTAACFVVRGSMPVAQDVLKYTAAGASNKVKLTVATDVKADRTEEEIDRTQVNLYQRAFDDITVTGTVVIKNYKPSAVSMSVTRLITGEVMDKSEGGKVTRSARNLASVNPNSDINWEFNLASGEEKTLTYKYHVLIGR